MRKEKKFSLEIKPAKAGPEFIEIRYVRNWENLWLTNLLKNNKDTEVIIQSIKNDTGDSNRKLSLISRMALKWLWGGKATMYHGSIGSESEGNISIYTYTDKANEKCVWIEASRHNNSDTPYVACKLDSTFQLLEDLKIIS